MENTTIISFDDAANLRKNSILNVNGKDEVITFVDKSELDSNGIVWVYTNKYETKALGFCRDERIAKKVTGTDCKVEDTGKRYTEPKAEPVKAAKSKPSTKPEPKSNGKKVPSIGAQIRMLSTAGLSVKQIAAALEVMPVMIEDMVKKYGILIAAPKSAKVTKPMAAAKPVIVAAKSAKKQPAKSASLKAPVAKAAKVIKAAKKTAKKK